MLPRIPELIGVAGDTVRTNFPSDRVGEMLDLAGGLDGQWSPRSSSGRPYSRPRAAAERRPAGTYIAAHLDLAQGRRALSIKVFGSESTYPQP